MKVLSVAEKPSVAKQLAEVISNGQRYDRRVGVSQFNPNWLVKTSINQGQQCNMVITSVSGHLKELCFGPESKWGKVDERVLFTAQVHKKVKEEYIKVAENLKKEIRGCGALVLWLDCDEEGENIAQEVTDVCKECARRNLKIYRARFSSITSREITRALRNLGHINQRVVQAVDTRTEIDLRLGAIFTRFQSGLLGGRFENVSNTISYGPCQFPTLGFVTERYKMRENFIKRRFWSIQVKHKQIPSEADPREGQAEFLWARQRIFDRLVVYSIFEDCVEHPEAKVIKVVAKEIRKFKPLPLQTVEFQKLASQKLRINSSEAMEIAEQLYQQGFLSYPRTETDQYPSDFEFNPLIQEQVDHPAWGSYAQDLLNGGFNQPRNGKRNDQAHPPIHPTKKAPDLEGNHKKIYDLITRYFLASCSDDALGESTVVELDIADETFSTRGLSIVALNFFEILKPYERWRGRVIPNYHEGEVFLPSEINMTDGQTEPPPLLTESALISIMDREGIGTDATIASHIKKIQERCYSKKLQGKYFTPTPFGLALINAYTQISRETGCLAKPYLRAHMETDCKAIIAGTKQADIVKKECLEDMIKVYDTVRACHKELYESVKTQLRSRGRGPDFINVRPVTKCTCGKCGRELVLKRSREKIGRNNTWERVFFCVTCNDSFPFPPYLKPPFSNIPGKKCPTCRSTLVKADSAYGTNEKCPRGCDNNNQRLHLTPIMPCLTCRGSMVLRKTKRSTVALFCSCRQCDTAIYLPDNVIEAEASLQQCTHCCRELAHNANGHQAPKVFLLKLKFKRGSLLPGHQLTRTDCVRGHSDYFTRGNNCAVSVKPSRNACTSSMCSNNMPTRRVQYQEQQRLNNSSSRANQHGTTTLVKSRMLSKPKTKRKPSAKTTRKRTTHNRNRNR